jgi:uroporphyrin-III C-methyltransferase
VVHAGPQPPQRGAFSVHRQGDLPESIAWHAICERLPRMSRGRVYLIGAGPGDPDLMTLRAVRALAAADMILADQLVDARCLAYARGPVIRVGKRGGCASTPQAFIERLMIRLARQGKVVARLKGGDPFIFGRGGEELAALHAAGIEAEVVPGITAGVGVAAALGLPLTQRGSANAVTLVCAHSAQPVNWAALREARGTLVIYMALARLRETVAAMLAAAFDPRTPACAVQSATLPSQRAVFSSLEGLPASVEEARLAAPALVIVGEVVARAGFQHTTAEEMHVRRHH